MIVDGKVNSFEELTERLQQEFERQLSSKVEKVDKKSLSFKTCSFFLDSLRQLASEADKHLFEKLASEDKVSELKT